jgi:hypothetical protein
LESKLKWLFFARQLWFLLHQFADLSAALSKQPDDPSLEEWWKKVECSVGTDLKKDEKNREK